MVTLALKTDNCLWQEEEEEGRREMQRKGSFERFHM